MNANAESTIWKRSALRSVCAAVLLLCAAAVALSCSAVGGGASAPSDPEELILEDATSIVETNYRALLEASELPSAILDDDQDTLDAQDELWDEWDDQNQAFGTEAGEVDTVLTVFVEGGYYGYMIVKGVFEFADIQNELEDQDYEEDTYRNLQIWSDEFGYSVALFEESGIYVYGQEDTIRDVLKAIDRVRASWTGKPT